MAVMAPEQYHQVPTHYTCASVSCTRSFAMRDNRGPLIVGEVKLVEVAFIGAVISTKHVPWLRHLGNGRRTGVSGIVMNCISE